MPVVKPCPPDGLLRNVEAQRTDQMQTAAGGGAGSGDIATVLGDLGFHQYDIQQETHLKTA
jgi:hypothetical protein